MTKIYRNIMSCSHCGSDIVETEGGQMFRVSTPRVAIEENCSNCDASPHHQYVEIEPVKVD